MNKLPFDAVVETARQVIASQGMAPDKQAAIAGRLRGHNAPTLRAACEMEHGAMVTAGATLGPHGWIVPNIPAAALACVYAVASLIAAERAADDMASALECQGLVSDAVFMLGRDDMRRVTLETEGMRRRANAAKGAPRPTFSDSDLNQFVKDWTAKYGRIHGVRTAAAQHFGVTDTAIGKRLRKIRTG